MRILWYSNSPFAATGYGNQTELFMRFMAEYEHDLGIICNHGYQGMPLHINNKVRLYGSGRASASNDVIAGTAAAFDADIVVSLYDAWPLDFARNEHYRDVWRKLEIPWVAWAPIDHVDVPPKVFESLDAADFPVAYSQHGYDAMIRAGLEATYIPHGIDVQQFRPIDKYGARERMMLPHDAFVVGMVAANNCYPARKAFAESIAGFADFASKHDGHAILYMHTAPTSERGGLDLIRIAKSFGLEPHQVIFCDQHYYNYGHPINYMTDVYNAIDVLLNPALGEGFGIPIAEAMACGTPVIGNSITSMPQLIADKTYVKGGGMHDRGALVGGTPWWSPQGGWQQLPDARDIAWALTGVRNILADHPEYYAANCVNYVKENLSFDLVAKQWNDFLVSI